MRATIAAFFAGLIFGLGLVISQMVNPAKVLGFLDLFGNWDPSLAFVMGGAVVMSAIGLRIARLRGAPLLGLKLDIPTRRDIDVRLVGGSVLFGVGWGLVGLCPGPALTSLPLGQWQVAIFVAAMVVGMILFRLLPAGLPRPSSKH
jgi:uncharacterized membrane protein YedE/YeeE